MLSTLRTIKLPVDLITDARFTPAERLALICIRECYEIPNMTALSDEINISRETISKAHAKAIKWGVFTHRHFLRGGIGRRNKKSRPPMAIYQRKEGTTRPSREIRRRDRILSSINEISSRTPLSTLYYILGVHPGTNEFLQWGKRGRITKVPYWSTYVGKIEWIYYDVRMLFRREVRRARDTNNPRREEQVAEAFAAVRNKHREHGYLV